MLLTLSGPAYFEQKLQIFQLLKNDLFLPDLSKCEHQKNFQSVIFFETVGIAQWNITIWVIKPCIAPFFFSLDCMTADETAFLDIISGDKSYEMTSSEA